MQELWAKGMLNAKTRCWAQGMDGWRPLQAIPQLKWCLLASGQAVLNETDLATLILNMLITMCGYFPSRYNVINIFMTNRDSQISSSPLCVDMYSVMLQGYYSSLTEVSCVT